MDTTSIKSRAMLADLSIYMPKTKKTDRSVTDEVAEIKHAVRDAGSYIKNIFPRSFMSQVKSVETSARAAHYNLTFSGFSQRGPRLLCVDAFDQHLALMDHYKTMFVDIQNDMRRDYWTIKSARRNQLGDMWDESEFPTEEQFFGAFSFNIHYAPIPDVDNWILNLDEERLSELRTEVEDQVSEQLSATLNASMERAYDFLEELLEQFKLYHSEKNRVDASDGKQKGAIPGMIKSATLDRMSEFAETLAAMNITQDQRIIDLSNKIRRSLCRFPSEHLRFSPSARETIINEVDDTLEDIKHWMAA